MMTIDAILHEACCHGEDAFDWYLHAIGWVSESVGILAMMLVPVDHDATTVGAYSALRHRAGLRAGPGRRKSTE